MWTEPSRISGLACVLLAACSSRSEPTGRLVVHRGEEHPVLCTLPAASGPLTCEASAGRFAGAARPGHPDLAVIETVDDAEGHRERLVRWSAVDAPIVELTPWAPQVRTPAWSADGERIATATTLGGVPTLFQLGGSVRTEPITVHEHPGGSFEPTWHPDGQTIAFASSRDGNAEIYTIPRAGGTPTRLTDHPGDDVRPRFSASGQLAWISDRGGLQQVHILHEGFVVHLVVDNPHPEVDLAWSPDGQRLAVVSGAGPDTAKILVVDPTTGHIVHTVEHADKGLEHAAWSPDGAWLAMSCRGSGAPSAICVSRSTQGTPRVVATSEESLWMPRWPQG